MKSFPTALFCWSFGAHLTDWAINPIEHAHAAPYRAQGARAHGIHVPPRGDECGSSGYPRAYEDEHVHENGRECVSGYAHGNEQDLHACAYEYAYGNADVNDQCSC